LRELISGDCGVVHNPANRKPTVSAACVIVTFAEATDGCQANRR